MKRKSRIIVSLVATSVLVIIIAWSGVLLQVTSAHADSPAEVQIRLNAPDEVSPDSDFTATVDINHVENFDATNYDVSFDTSVLRLDDVTSGQLNSTTVPVDLWQERGPGIYVVIQNMPGLTGVSGAGNLAVLRFHVIGSQSRPSTINLSNGVLSSNEAEGIPATWTGASVTVEAGESQIPTSTPPSTSPPPSSPQTSPPPQTSSPPPPPPTSTLQPPSLSPSPAITPAEEVPATHTGEVVDVKPSSGKLPASTPPVIPQPAPPPTSLSIIPAEPMPAMQPAKLNWPLICGIFGAIVIGLVLFTFIKVKSQQYY